MTPDLDGLIARLKERIDGTFVKVGDYLPSDRMCTGPTFGDDFREAIRTLEERQVMVEILNGTACDEELCEGAAACGRCIKCLQAERDAAISAFKTRKIECDALRAELAECKAQLEIIRDKLVSPELLESLAAVEHNRWAGWMRYQETASAERRADWPRKTALAYTQLTHDEQESDREEVRTTLAIIEDSLNAALSAARAQGEKDA